ncbi:hypothetical protein SK128_024868 [Halocaridina rubra]|uniref:PHD finger protein 20 n=1 Tax=Halocaridina rubra TaxID=373956 RepID=A0AAN8X6C7_HALRR
MVLRIARVTCIEFVGVGRGWDDFFLYSCVLIWVARGIIKEQQNGVIHANFTLQHTTIKQGVLSVTAMLKVGSKFYTFDELSKRLEEFQQVEKVQLWVRDSRTVVAAAKRARRKSLNPALKYAELTYSCVFGGRRPSDQTKTHNQTSAGGCPFKVRLSTSIDGQALVVKEICHDHNHEPGKKLHEEPRRLYKKSPNNNNNNSRSTNSVRKPVRYIVNKQRVNSDSSNNATSKSKSRLENSESSHIALGQSPFHHLHLHQQQYQQQQQIKLQLQQHLQQQQQQQLRQRQAEVIQLDSPDHIDTPDHLSSPDLSSTSFDQLGSLNNSVDQFSYLPPSPISPSLSSGCIVDCEEDERLEPILDLEEALEEALGDLDSVGSMEVDANLRLFTLGSSAPSLVSQSEICTSQSAADDPTGPPPAKRQRGRPRKQSFSGTPPSREKMERDHSGDSKDGNGSPKESDFLGFTNPMDKGKSEAGSLSLADIAQANAMARQLHVYKPGIDFVTGARLEVLDTRDNNWYQCKVVEVDWGELDILVHYERWSNRFDEWLKMDSTRIRPLCRASSRKEKKGGPFKIGDKVTARWPSDGKRYQAKIIKCLGDDQYEVLFMDGVTKIVRAGGLTRVDFKASKSLGESGTNIDESSSSSPKKLGQEFDNVMLLSPAGTTASSNDSLPSSPEAAVGENSQLHKTVNLVPRKSIFDVEIIEQKRKPKRKAAVEELFESIKKRRKSEGSPPFKSKESHSSSSRFDMYMKEKKKKQSKVVFPVERGSGAGPSSRSSERDTSLVAIKKQASESHVSTPYPNAVIISMGKGWKKCIVKRITGTSTNKWDVYFVGPDEKKLRSRHDLMRYLIENGISYDAEKFDFSLKNLKGLIEAHLPKPDAKDQSSCGKLKTHSKGHDALYIQEHTIDPAFKEYKASFLVADTKTSTKTAVIRHPSDVQQGSHCSSCLEESKEFLTVISPVVESKETFGTAKDTPNPDVSVEEKKVAVSVPLKSGAAECSGDTHLNSEEKELYTEEIKKENIETSTQSTEPLISSKPFVRKPDMKMKIEIPIMPKTEPMSSLSAGIIGSVSKPWSPKPGVIQKSLSLEDKDKEEDQNEVSITSPSVEGGISATGPSSTTPSTAGSSKQSITTTRQKHVIKKEPILAPNEFVVKSQHNEHMCPKEGCLKSFRKENLLQMHIKHYHPEILKKGRTVAPNVADLAYARTVGDHLDLTATQTALPLPIEKSPKSDSLGKKSKHISTLGDSKGKIPEKKSHSSPGMIPSSSLLKAPKDAKKKELLKIDPLKAKLISDEDSDGKEDMEEYVDDLEEEENKSAVVPTEVQVEDPDYLPSEDDASKKRDRKKKSKPDTKTKKKRSVSEQCMSEVITSGTMGKKSQSTEENSALDVAEEDTTDTWCEGAESVSVPEAPAEIINCGCGSTEEEGLMLQCDICLCWQHGSCYNIIGEDQVPDEYICSLCDHPRLERSSHKFRHHQDWLKEGRIPRFSFSRTRGDARLESCIRRGHELTGNVLQLSQVLHSLRLKLHIAKEADHPKFVMWHKQWNEKEETSDTNNGATTSRSTEAMECMQDLMDIVSDESSTLPSTLPSTSIESSVMDNAQLLGDTLDSIAGSSASQAVPGDSTDTSNQSGVPPSTCMETNTHSQVVSTSGLDVKISNLQDQKITDMANAPIAEHQEGKFRDTPDETSHLRNQKSSDIQDTKTSDNQETDLESAGKTDTTELLSSSDVKEEDRDQFETCDSADISLSEGKLAGSPELKNVEHRATDSPMLSKSHDESVSTVAEKASDVNNEGGEGLKSIDTSTSSDSKPSAEVKSEVDISLESFDNFASTTAKVLEQMKSEDMKDYIDVEATSIPARPYCNIEMPQTEKADEESFQEEQKESVPDTASQHLVKLTESSASQSDKKEELEETMDESLSLSEEDELKEGADEKKMIGTLTPEENEIVSQVSPTEKDDVDAKAENVTELIGRNEEAEGEDKKEENMKAKPGDSIDKVPDEIKKEEDLQIPSQDIQKLVKSEKDAKNLDKTKTTLDELKNCGEPCDKTCLSDASQKECLKENSGLEVIKPEPVKQFSSKSGELEEIEIVDAVSRDLEDIELPHPGEVDTTDLTHTEDLEGTGEGLEGDAHLDDADLALDLGGLEAPGESGMPENSDLAALLSSQTELERLVTQASSALASHVPASSSQPVSAPIIPEAERIEPVNCKLNLLEHVQVLQGNINRRFDQIEKQLEVLEAEMGLTSDLTDDEGEEESEERDPATLQARALIKLIMNDISVVKKISDFSG